MKLALAPPPFAAPPKDASFRVGKWATKPENVAKLHHSLNHDAEREFKRAKGGSKTA